ncbi:MAG: T9SS type A sorting domain-containing protein [FCB group bacterium]|jgi:hypothetical protein
MKTRLLFTAFLFVIAILFSTSISADVVQPAGGENGEYWMKTTVHSIQWDTSYFHNLVKIYLWCRPTGQMIQIATNIQASLGAYSWTIPQNIPTGNNFRIKVQQTNNSSIYAMSETFFPIYPYQQPIKSVVKDNVSSPTKISVFPNPANHNINIKWTDNFDARYLTIYNIHGTKVVSRQLSEKENYIQSTEEMSPGVYFIELKADEYKKLTTKFILEK